MKLVSAKGKLKWPFFQNLFGKIAKNINLISSSNGCTCRKIVFFNILFFALFLMHGICTYSCISDMEKSPKPFSMGFWLKPLQCVFAWVLWFAHCTTFTYCTCYDMNPQIITITSKLLYCTFWNISKHLAVFSSCLVSVIRHGSEDNLHLTLATGTQKITGLA